MTKIGFFFGAGAEKCCYRMPSGAEFVFKTLCTRKKYLYEALSSFYAGRDIEGYAKGYQAEFLFTHRSHAYRRMIELSARSALGINYDNEKTDKNIVELCFSSKDSSAEHKTYRDKVQKAYDEYKKTRSQDSEAPKVKDSTDAIVKVLYMLSLNDALKQEEIKGVDEFAKKNRDLKSALYYLLLDRVEKKDKPEKDHVGFEQYDDLSKFGKEFIVSFIKDNLKYYGVVEQDFSTIINPQKAGIVRFWRLVNYFWSAYFSILIPMIRLSSKYESLVKNEKHIYRELLNTGADGQPFLVEVLHHLASKDYLEESLNKAKEEPYYGALKKELGTRKIPIDFVLTTNYTPFVKTFGLKDDKYCYLAGTVFQFEYPYELRTIDVRDKSSGIKSNDLVFPYIMTQAPVKPIIESQQISEYSKAIKYLDGCDLLIILGYSLCENDNHINSLLREYITKPNKKMLVCHYCNPSDFASCQSKPGEEEKESLYKKLRVKKDEVAGKIDLIPNDGNAAGLAKMIDKYINKKLCLENRAD